MSGRWGFLVAIVIGLVAARARGQQIGSAPAFGATSTSYLSVGPPEFNPSLNDGLNDALFIRTYFLISFGGTGDFLAMPHLPDGALLSSLRLDYCDSAAEHMNLLLYDCVTTTQTCDGYTLVGQATSTSGGNCSFASVDLSAANYTVDNVGHKLFLELTFGVQDTSNKFRGAVIGYKLQVSPPPVTASFGDVPASHPFFQFIEALKASGITGGCGGGNFCPDSPVTRGQMAVFLAKALGLQWP